MTGVKSLKRSTKFKRSKNGCWTCKARKRKCDEAKPICNNCVKSSRKCLGYQKLLAFDVDTKSMKGRPKLKESLAARGIDLLGLSKQSNDNTPTNFIVVTTKNFHDKLKKPRVNMNNDDKVVSFDFPEAGLKISDSKSLSTGLEVSNNELDDLWNIDLSQLQPNQNTFFIQYFIYKVVHLFDNLESSPFPKLVMKYCHPELARSCFVTLSSIHIYGYSKDASDYDQSMDQLDVITNELLMLISLDGEQINNNEIRDDDSIHFILTKLKQLPIETKSSKVITVLILIYVQTMFSILESGRSAISEFLFKLGSLICYDADFRDVLTQDKDTRFLVMLIGWFETISVFSLSEPRRSYLRVLEFDRQYELRLRSEDITGCPDEIFTSLLDILDLRYTVYLNGIREDSYTEKEKIINSLSRYREFVSAESFNDDEKYIDRLLGAQIWSIASMIYLHKLLPSKNKSVVKSLTKEFIHSFLLFDEESEIKKQSIWPLVVVGEVSESESDRKNIIDILDLFYKQNKMGNVKTLKSLLKTCWDDDVSLESILQGTEWNSSGVFLLPL